MSDHSDARQLGDYRLKELLGETEMTRTWLAEQVSISRLVLVDELLSEQDGRRAEFLADVRAKAAVDHPLVGSVYEAVAEPGLCFYAHELLPGLTLAALESAGKRLSPALLTPILRRVVEAQLQHEALGQATCPLDLDAIHQDEHGVIRLKNFVIAGPRSPEQSVRDVTRLGASLGALVAEGRPGATRLLTLLGWMRGEGVEVPISWPQVFDFCQQIEQQLADPLSLLSPTQHANRPGKKPPVALISGAVALVLLGVVGFAMMRPSTPPAPPRASLPAPVTVEAGKYPTPDGLEQTLPVFKISAHEVTIGEYAEFLETLEILAKDQNDRIFDHAEQPTEKKSHLPDDWSSLFAAGKSNGTWNGVAATLDSPVVGVDWWDAVAFAEWKKARLPSQEEWFAALMVKAEPSPGGIAPGPWLPVTSQTGDRTPTGLLGMAGSVCEWTGKAAPNPANPLGGKLWVVIGGSYLKPGSNALSREWIADRSLRRPDLGFRLAYDPE